MNSVIIKLFFGFLKVGLFSVGGGYAAIPLIQHQIVDTLGLMNIDEFVDLVTIAEMTPGPISINSATFVGNRLSGFFGAIICTIGVIIPSFIICLILAKLYYKYQGLDDLQVILASLRPAVVALIASAGLSILTLALFNAEKHDIVWTDFRYVEAFLFVLGFVLIRKFKVNPIAIIFGSGVLGTLIY